MESGLYRFIFWGRKFWATNFVAASQRVCSSQLAADFASARKFVAQKFLPQKWNDTGRTPQLGIFFSRKIFERSPAKIIIQLRYALEIFYLLYNGRVHLSGRLIADFAWNRKFLAEKWSKFSISKFFISFSDAVLFTNLWPLHSPYLTSERDDCRFVW